MLAGAGLPVPEWFAVTPGVLDAGALQRALEKLAPGGECFAVRSSAIEEDSPKHSFAGQLESFLFVQPRDVANRVECVRASASAHRVLAYRRQHGLPDSVPAPAVIVQRMIDPECSGVAFSADPVSGRRSVAVVAAVRGSAVPLVEGTAEGLTWHVDRGGRILFRPPCTLLDDSRVREVATLARQAERLFARPQDIEWVSSGDRLWIVQSRPITSLAGMADPDGGRHIWDNSNIVESYGGIVSPMTFSFARRAYEGVYKRFCRVMGVPSTVIETHADVFRGMLGLVRGRVYYNLLNWYRVVAMLPGYRWNRTFFEQMLGAREALHADQAGSLAAETRWRRLRGSLALAHTLAGVVLQYFSLPMRVLRFRRRLDNALGKGRPYYGSLRADELAVCYRELERQLLPNWDAPIVNDFFCMVFVGVLHRLSARWCDEALDSSLLACGGACQPYPPAALESHAPERYTPSAFGTAARHGQQERDPDGSRKSARLQPCIPGIPGKVRGPLPGGTEIGECHVTRRPAPSAARCRPHCCIGSTGTGQKR